MPWLTTDRKAFIETGYLTRTWSAESECQSVCTEYILKTLGVLSIQCTNQHSVYIDHINHKWCIIFCFVFGFHRSGDLEPYLHISIFASKKVISPCQNWIYSMDNGNNVNNANNVNNVQFYRRFVSICFSALKIISGR